MQTWLKYCKQLNQDNPVINPAWWDDKRVNPYCLIDALSEYAREDDVICPGASSFAPQLVYQAWRVKQGQRFTYMGAMGAMGTGLPAAIGACLATGRRVISVIGDGGFQLNIQELEVVKRLQLPIKYFVLYNGGYAAIKATQTAYFEGRLQGCTKESGLTLPDVGKLAEAFGIEYDLIRWNHEVKDFVKDALDNDKPIIVEVVVPDEFQLAHRVKRIMVDGRPTSGAFGEVE